MRYILRRLGFYLLAFWAAITLDFFLPRLLPGDPAATILGSGGQLDPSQVQALREALGLTDQPLILQYFTYLTHAIRGDFGISFSNFPVPVITVILTGLWWTLLLGGSSVIISFIIGNLIGIFGSWRRGGAVDSFVPPLLVLVGAFPPFFLGLCAIYLLAFQLHWFPTRHAYEDTLVPGFDPAFFGSVITHMLLPVIVLVLSQLGGWALGMRNTMVSVLAEDYITMAEAKGLTQNRIMFRYAARNAMLPSVTAFGIVLGFVLSGQLLIEQIFSYPGLGFLLISAVQKLDYPLMQGLFLMITFAVLVANFIVDIVYTRLDPRVRAG
ncbi:MAG: ABC transporter permease [Chloroflexi bacterium]|nr:ABC transporter permease [Chloroflexota bacterium]OJV90110.1 MAG: peptide ABC transporter permease [Chloroflexi bacterium 54-19]